MVANAPHWPLSNDAHTSNLKSNVTSTGASPSLADCNYSQDKRTPNHLLTLDVLYQKISRPKSSYQFVIESNINIRDQFSVAGIGIEF